MEFFRACYLIQFTYMSAELSVPFGMTSLESNTEVSRREGLMRSCLALNFTQSVVHPTFPSIYKAHWHSQYMWPGTPLCPRMRALQVGFADVLAD